MLRIQVSPPLQDTNHTLCVTIRREGGAREGGREEGGKGGGYHILDTYNTLGSYMNGIPESRSSLTASV